MRPLKLDVLLEALEDTGPNKDAAEDAEELGGMRKVRKTGIDTKGDPLTKARKERMSKIQADMTQKGKSPFRAIRAK